jgi:hypothetical protein
LTPKRSFSILPLAFSLPKQGGLVRPILLATSLSILGSSAFAQSDRGTITGTVADPAGAVVANAPIQAKNLENGAVYEGATSTTGNYTLAQLPAGAYEVSVAVPGFKKYTRQGLAVQVAQTLRIDVVLKWARPRTR